MLVPVSEFPTLKSYKNSAVALVVVALHALVLWALHSGVFSPAKAVERSKSTEIVIPITLKQVLPVATVHPPKPIAPAEIVAVPAAMPAKSQVKPTSVVQAAIEPTAVSAQQPAAATKNEKSTLEPVAVPTSAAAATALASTVLPTSQAESSKYASSASASASTSTAATASKPIKVSPSTIGGELSDANKIYPRSSQTMGEQGNVYIRFFVNIDGVAENTEVERSSGFERLDQAALIFVQQSRYKPGALDGVPTRMLFARTVTYKLDR
jgi:periplasmic protein TonB